MEDDKLLPFSSEENNHGWQKVTYAKKKRNNQIENSSRPLPNGSSVPHNENTVFKSLEKQAEERRRKLEARRASASIYDEDEISMRSRKNWGDDAEGGSSDADANSKENNASEANKKEKPVKMKKPMKVKKPKVTVAEAAANIDASDLAAFLASISEMYEGKQDIQLMRFADYFGRAFSAVSASQFPWLKLFRESAVTQYADIPVSYIPESVYKTSIDWFNHHSYEALETFVFWSLDSILSDLAMQQPGSKNSKKRGPSASSKSQVAIFLVLAIVLRRKPDVLSIVLPKLSENLKHQAQDKLQVIIWMVVQASLGDLTVGLLLWSNHILPILGRKSGSNPQSRDLVLQIVERIVSAPKARGILVNGAVRKGERLVPPAALDLLLRLTFPASSSRVKATERFEATYPILKEVTLSGSPGSKAMKQVSQKIQTIALKACGEGISELSQEAVDIFIWCLTQNPDCYQQWDEVYMDNIEASVAILKKLSEEWKKISLKQHSLQALGVTLKSFQLKNEKASSDGVGVSRQAFVKDSDKYCKSILGKVSNGLSCVKTVVLTVMVLALGAAVITLNLDSFDWNKCQFCLMPSHKPMLRFLGMFSVGHTN